MPYLDNTVLDPGLQYIVTNGNRVDACTAEPATYTQATSTYSKGYKLTPAYTGPAARTPTGRRITVNAITDGTVSGSGDCTHWAVSKTTATTALLAAGALAGTVTVTSGSIFTLTAFDIGFAQPT